MVESNGHVSVARHLLDLTLGLVPVVSVGKDIYEVVTGSNFVTGEELGAFDRTLSAISVLSLGGSNIVKGPLKILEKVVAAASRKGIKSVRKGTKEAIAGAEKVAGSAEKAGLQPGEKTKKFFGYLGDFAKDESGSLDLGKVAEFLGSQAGKIIAESPFNLRKTHQLTKSKGKFAALKNQIASDGHIKETIKYVEHNGEKFIVDGHHRVRAAMELGIKEIPVEKVQLPYKGYQTLEDLLNW